MVSSAKIRRAFLQYFKDHGHKLVASSPVIPHDDPTLLFINAGMNQFKDVFLGKSKRDYTRATTTQKCIRAGGKHNDLENVGHTSRHLTFFEMLGNFSFGDYFKKEAIQYAWDVSTNIFQLDPDRIWVSVFENDDEAFALWEKHLPQKRIVRFGEKENFWSMGDVGPCGPCSELLYDRGDFYSKAENPVDDPTGERFLEFWNLVFMQFDRSLDGSMIPLPKQSIDTGSGLERVVSLSMGVDSVFQTDILKALIDQIAILSGEKYVMNDLQKAPPFHVIADHIRTLSFAIADGAQPSNTDRGYVLRKILRRAVRYGRMLGFNRPFLSDLLPCLIQTMGEDFPELKNASKQIGEILWNEEESFLRTLSRGGAILSQVIQTSKKSSKQISGDDAFKLKDTYGLPLEEVLLLAKDEHLSVDLHRYQQLDQEAKEKSRKAQKTAIQKFETNLFTDFIQQEGATIFEGYQQSTLKSKVKALLVNGIFVEKIEKDQEAFIILDKTPFYAEMGGQIGDQGIIQTPYGIFQVLDTISPYPGVIAHLGTMESGAIQKGEVVTAAVNMNQRKAIQNNHTATHLLHWALEKVLGSHIKQAGSFVDHLRLRFDFNHHKALSTDEIRQIETLVNEKIRDHVPVQSYELPFEEAQNRRDIKQFFGEKYGAKVRVIDVDFSKELCGGTHTTNTGTIGFFKIIKEGSVAAGVRRIEAVTGKAAEEWLYEQEDFLKQIASLLKTSSHTVMTKIEHLIQENHSLSEKNQILRKKERSQLSDLCLAQVESIGDIKFIAQEIHLPTEELPLFAEELLSHLKSGVIALGITSDAKCQLLISVTQDLIKKNIHANELIKKASPLIEGGGGGKSALAQAGGKNPSGLIAAFNTIRQSLKDY